MPPSLGWAGEGNLNPERKAVRNDRKHVRLLMATRDGGDYLRAQLDSVLAQDHQDWSLDVADDGSQDDTRDILREYTARHARIRYFYGPGRGLAANFLFLLARATRERPDAIVGFVDQDDVWMPSKITMAVDWITGQKNWSRASLAHTCQTILTNADLHPIGLSKQPERGPFFGNALVQNIMHGNVTMLSPAAAGQVARTVPAAISAGVPFHDWWVYLVLTGTGAQIHSDARAGLYYRQHGRNQLGHHSRISGKLSRLGLLLQGTYGDWIDRNLAALDTVKADLSADAQNCLEEFVAARQMFQLAPSVQRQSQMGDHLLALLAKTGRLNSPNRKLESPKRA